MNRKSVDLLIVLLFWSFSFVACSYALGGALIIIHSEAGFVSLVKDKFSELVSVAGGLFSAVAVFLSYKAAERAAIAAEKSSINACMSDRMEVKEALIEIWGFLNIKSAVLALEQQNPERFLVTPSELELIKSQRVPLNFKTASFGADFSRKLQIFYANVSSKLQAQQSLCDYDREFGDVLYPERQKIYLEERVGMRNEAEVLLKELEVLLYKGW